MTSKRIPKFKSEDEVHAFWATHDFMDYIDDTEPVEIECVAPRPELPGIRLTETQQKQLERLAAKAGVTCETLAGQWLAERLRQETRSANGRRRASRRSEP